MDFSAALMNMLIRGFQPIINPSEVEREISLVSWLTSEKLAYLHRRKNNAKPVFAFLAHRGWRFISILAEFHTIGIPPARLHIQNRKKRQISNLSQQYLYNGNISNDKFNVMCKELGPHIKFQLRFIDQAYSQESSQLIVVLHWGQIRVNAFKRSWTQAVCGNIMTLG